MEFAYGPIEDKEPSGFEPLEWDDNEYEDEYVYLSNDEGIYEDDDFEDPGLPGFDDLMPFGGFDSGFGWEDGYL